MSLLEIAKACRSVGEFIGKIQQSPDDLLNEVYAWEQADPARKRKYEHSGWFAIASDFYNLSKSAK